MEYRNQPVAVAQNMVATTNERITRTKLSASAHAALIIICSTFAV
jgi:hypothetical protein